MSHEVCYKCDGNCHTPLPDGNGKTGIIYVRDKNKDGKFDSMPICRLCWDKANPDRPCPVMMKDDIFTEKKN